DKREIYEQRVRKIDHAKIRIDEIKAKVNSLEKELLEIKQLDRLLIGKDTFEKSRKTTIYKGDDILFVGELSYQRFPNHKLVTWEEANEYAKKLKIAGYDDWRLPTIEELEGLLTKRSLKNSKRDSHYVLRDFLEIMPQDSCFWSSSEENELYSWLADFGKGYTYWRRKTLKYYALYVRKT
ncbi:DUF1566 domain-containing protein, partial [Sulfurovum sp. bin170]|uniref:Lcl C-terminal domain-containing protein n=1 Tax=Sulfurovum sp. bin170 TaxID=2695268 RepID=UPI0013DE8135